MTVLRHLLLTFLTLAALLFTGCGKKVDPAQAATQFLEQIGSGKAQEAYDSATFGFQAQQTSKVFQQTARELGLMEFASARWDSTEVNGRTAKVRGEVSSKAGKKMEIVVTLNEEGGRWRVFSMKSPRDVATGRVVNPFSLVGKGAAFKDALSQPMPEEKVVKAMVKDTLLLFNGAIQQKSFTEFYSKVAASWQRQLTEGQLQRAFQPFIDREVDISEVEKLEPKLDPPPYIATDGLLVVTGEYPTTPHKTVFKLKYIYELPKWRLFGIDVNLQK